MLFYSPEDAEDQNGYEERGQRDPISNGIDQLYSGKVILL